MINTLNNQNNKTKVKINEDISYLIGVLHSDGCIYRFKSKKRNFDSIRINLHVAHKSLPMIIKFQEIFLKYFNRRVNIRKVPNKNAYVIQTSINRIYYIFKEWEKGQIPIEINNNPSLFGAYLAGLIDGDGYVKLKNRKDRKLPQLVVWIANNKPLFIIQNLIKKFMYCGAHISPVKDKNCYQTCFYITHKNLKFFKEFVRPYLTIIYKITELEKYEKIIEPARI